MYSHREDEGEWTDADYSDNKWYQLGALLGGFILLGLTVVIGVVHGFPIWLY